MTFDPLSSQGLLHALFTGLAAAEARTATSPAIPARQPAISRSCTGSSMRTGKVSH
jgi:hypothetical protein